MPAAKNCTLQTFDDDGLGRPIHDRVTTVGTGIDNAVLRISTEYEVRGLVETISSYDHATVGLSDTRPFAIGGLRGTLAGTCPSSDFTRERYFPSRG